MTRKLGAGWSGAPRRWSVVLFAAIVSASVAPAAAGTASDPVAVIVRAPAGEVDMARNLVEESGGTIVLDLSIIDGFSATIPSGSVERLSAAPEILSLSPDASIRLSGFDPNDPAAPGAMQRINTKVIRSDVFWSSGFTGAGVGVAVIDSGVAPVGGLDAAGKIRNGPDLSFDGEFPEARHLDAFGHGTHVAGIIAGQDPSLPDRSKAKDVRARFSGVAPDAHLVNVKVADAYGTADVSQVIAAIDWVVEYKDDGVEPIRILNLAFGTDGQQSHLVDPLMHAVEVAWDAGIVVVAAAGNDGNTTPLRNPARDPLVISVGAVDARGTYGSGDDQVLDFSNCGDPERPVDVLAPGLSVTSLRVPGSYVDRSHPTARVGERFFKGTGTSQAAAVVSGAVALLLDQRPDLTPDQVKQLLIDTAHARPSLRCGTAGVIDLRSLFSTPTPLAVQPHLRSDGSGSLEAARGSYHVYHLGVPVEGEADVTGGTWSGGTWSGGTWSGGTWSGGTWSGGTWSGGTWSGGTWSGGTWSTADWR